MYTAKFSKLNNCLVRKFTGNSKEIFKQLFKRKIKGKFENQQKNLSLSSCLKRKNQ